MFDYNVFIICFIITTSGNMLFCQKNYVLREISLKNSDNFKSNVISKCKVFPVPKRHDISEYEASGSKGPCGILFDILTNLL